MELLAKNVSNMSDSAVGMRTVHMRTPNLQSKSGWLLGILSAVDAALGLTLLAQAGDGIRSLLQEPLSPLMCFACIDGPRMVFQLSQAVFTAALAADCFFIIRFPIQYSSWPLDNYLSTWAWLVILAVTGQTMGMHYYLKDDYDSPICFCELTCVYDIALSRRVLAPLYLGSAGAVLLLSLGTLRRLKTSIEDDVRHQRPQVQRRRRFQRTLRCLLLFYVASYTSSVMAYATRDVLFPEKNGLVTIERLWAIPLLLLPGDVNRCANPLIYYILNRDYRDAMRRVLGRPTTAFYHRRVGFR